jgi:O-antigen/teichoic acid export membrane protein
VSGEQSPEAPVGATSPTSSGSLDAVLVDQPGPAPVPPGGRDARPGLLRSGGWSALAQVTPVLVNVAMTPYVIATLGLLRFGLYILLLTVADSLATFDGGINRSATRFFAVHHGRDDRPAAARLLLTLSLTVSAIGAVMFLVLFLCAPALLSLFDVPAEVRAEGEFLLRSLAVIIAFGILRGLYAAVLNGRQRFKATSLVTILQYAVYTAGVLFTLHHGQGLRGMAATLVVELVVSLLVLMVLVLRTVRIFSSGLMSRAEVRDFLGFTSRAQVVGLSDLITLQSQSLIIGGFLTVTRVGLYSSGANFASQLRRLPMNAIAPAGAALASTYAARGPAAALAEFSRLQRLWVQAVTGWTVVAAGAAWFGVTAWLGPEFALSGTVAVTLLVGFLAQLCSAMVVAYCQSIGHPEIGARASVVTLVVTLATAFCLVGPFGVEGVVAGSTAAQLVGAAYLLHLVSARLGSDVPSFVRELPLLPSAVAVLVTVGLQVLARPFVPGGALGLLACGLVAAPGLLTYVVLVLGPRQTLVLARAGADRLRHRPPVADPAPPRPVPASR